MLTRLVFTVWGAWLGALGLAAALTASGIWNEPPIFGVGLPVLMFGAGLGLVIAGARAMPALCPGDQGDDGLGHRALRDVVKI